MYKNANEPVQTITNPLLLIIDIYDVFLNESSLLLKEEASFLRSHKTIFYALIKANKLL